MALIVKYLRSNVRIWLFGPLALHDGSSLIVNLTDIQVSPDKYRVGYAGEVGICQGNRWIDVLRGIGRGLRTEYSLHDNNYVLRNSNI